MRSMAYDEALAQRVRELVAERAEFDEIKMFGGLGFMVNTHLAVGVSGEGGLMLKVADEASARERGATPMEMRGRPMTGWVRVQGDAVEPLDDWVLPQVEAALALPPKPPKPPKTR